MQGVGWDADPLTRDCVAGLPVWTEPSTSSVSRLIRTEDGFPEKTRPFAQLIYTLLVLEAPLCTEPFPLSGQRDWHTPWSNVLQPQDLVHNGQTSLWLAVQLNFSISLTFHTSPAHISWRLPEETVLLALLFQCLWNEEVLVTQAEVYPLQGSPDSRL